LELGTTSGPFPVVNPQATRDFVDARDVAEALTGLAMQAAVVPGKAEIYNIATGVETSLLELARELGGLAGGFVPVDGGCGDSRGGVTRSCGDSTRLRNVTGWAPHRTWQESVRDLWESLRGRRPRNDQG
jgi:nucleoside-diphosphate-sugar epimerase